MKDEQFNNSLKELKDLAPDRAFRSRVMAVAAVTPQQGPSVLAEDALLWTKERLRQLIAAFTAATAVTAVLGIALLGTPETTRSSTRQPDAVQVAWLSAGDPVIATLLNTSGEVAP